MKVYDFPNGHSFLKAMKDALPHRTQLENSLTPEYDFSCTPGVLARKRLSNLFKLDFQIIGEIKKSSPSEGSINQNISILDQVARYLSSGINIISVLTEPEYFSGSLHFINEIKLKYPKALILRKDFINHKDQIIKAKEFGADGILLISHFISKEKISELMEFAHSLGLFVLLETSSLEELGHALDTDADIVGINNRDLKSLDIDIRKTKELTTQIQSKLNMSEKILITESGIKSQSDLEYLKSVNGINGALIGTALMKGHLNLEKKEVQETPLLKLCGFNNHDELKFAKKLNVTFLGLVHYSQSVRHVDLSFFEEAIIKYKFDNIIPVLVNPSIDLINRFQKIGHFPFYQIHKISKETKEYMKTSKISFIESRGISQDQDLKEILKETSPGQIFHFDYKSSQIGGTGKSFSWKLLQDFKGRFHLAGGINKDNFKQALNTNAELVDLSSGIEKQRGLKSQKLISEIKEIYDNHRNQL